MADLRCPMCGKPNPASAEACKYCGARLTPVQSGGSKPAAPASKPGPEDADWMSDLRGDMMRNRPKTSMLPPEPPAPAPPSDNWLSKIDARGEKESQPAAPASKSKTPREPAPPPTPGKASEKSGNWLSKIRPQAEKESKPAAPASRPPSPPVSPGSRPPSSPVPPTSRPPAPSTSAPEAASEPPEWLSKVRAQTEADRPPITSAEGEKGGEEPVWLKRLRARRIQDELAPAATPPPEAEPTAPGELPDWLSRIREKTTEETGRIDAEDRALFSSPLSAPGPESSEPQSPASPWGTPAPPQKPRASEPPAPPIRQGVVPDWMKYPSEANRPSAEEPPVGSADWMGGISSALEQTPPTPPAKPGEIPGRPTTGQLLGAQNAEIKKGGSGRLSGRGNVPPAKKISPPTQPFGREPGLPAPGSAPSALGPDWDFPPGAPPEFPFDQPASNAGQSATPAAFNVGMEPMVSPGGEEEVPDWLVNIKKESAPPAPEPEQEPPIPTPDLNELLRPDSLPEWMHRPAGAASAEKPAGPAAPAGAAPDSLEQAELPRWLEAMRPIQSVTMPTEDEERVESVGPLAGLRGVLSAEPVVAMPRRPGIMAGNIDASPAQLTLTETLRRLLIEPEVRASRRPVRAMLLTPLLRKAMSAVLILAILFPFYAGSLFSSSVYQPKANIHAGEFIGQLPVDLPVLVAFEYDASSAPEMESGASALLEHLAERGISVAYISSQPNGTMLGEGMQMLNEEQGIKMPARIADFGYIPGGASGLRRLTDNFRETVKGANVDWNQPALEAIHSLSDFSMILVVAAGPQTVRDWVEQVHTAAPNTPIVAVVSAASDALVFPYTEGSKPAIWGLVAGFAGAQAYRAAYLPATLSASSMAVVRWQAFAGGTLAILITLVAGVIGSLVLGRIRRTRKAGE
jgi:hypothetical protein